ncbi:helix-turn-helix domain-containing protein [uncultured Veillonella sp.]|uniref:helix-turn-helix domain-containing protein n=1 Tax=uncultured Veillonella sp. TaxID=159268 RepID=UPI00260B1140|nr:helix-turn-helix domain-containing protein [uncultured Veillonella sp.]
MKARAAQRIVIPHQLLVQLYVEEKLSSWQIAKKLKCSQDTVIRRLHEYGIPIRSRRIELPLEEAISLYEQGVGVKQLAKRFNCSHTTMANRLRALGVLKEVKSPVLTPLSKAVEQRIVQMYKNGQSATYIGRILHVSRWIILATLRRLKVPIRYSNKRIAVNVDELAYLYEVHKLSTTELEDIYHVKAGTIGERLKEHGIKLRGHNLSINAFEVYSRYSQGESPMQIAESLGCSYTAVRARLIKWKKRS